MNMEPARGRDEIMTVHYRFWGVVGGIGYACKYGYFAVMWACLGVRVPYDSWSFGML
jgi:hypothetical protein